MTSNIKTFNNIYFTKYNIEQYLSHVLSKCYLSNTVLCKRYCKINNIQITNKLVYIKHATTLELILKLFSCSSQILLIYKTKRKYAKYLFYSS